MIGNWFGYYRSFILWGIITAILLSIAIINIYKKTNFQNKKAYRFLYYSMFFLILTVITPTGSNEPIEEELRNAFHINFHGIFGVLFSVFLIISLILFYRYLTLTNKKLSIRTSWWLFITVGGSLFTLFLFGMTGIFELFFFISLSIFLFIINSDIKKLNKEFHLLFKNK